VSERYADQLAVPDWDDAAQARLATANVFVVGAGARGSIAAGYLTAAGAAHLNIVDGDQVALQDLNRQLLHFTPDVAANKSESVRAKLALINLDVHVDPFPANVDENNVGFILEGADLVVDCTNDYATSGLINDQCVKDGRPLIVGGTDGWRGSLMTVLPGVTSCLRCAEPDGFDTPPPMEPSLGPIAGTVGSLQALEALKVLGQIGEPRTDVVSILDGRTLAWTHEPVERRPDCICAGG
jgi:molybdopterin/thiamine biosynthesis adenylyltransferase